MTLVAPPSSVDTERQILTIIQSAALVVGLPQPDFAFGSDVVATQELTDMATECAKRIGEAHDWTAIRATATLQGEGQTRFAMPDDFWRLTEGAKLYSSAVQDNLHHLTNPDSFQKAMSRSAALPSKVWMQSGEFIDVYPALSVGEVLSLQYVSNVLVSTATGDGRSFVADTDTFLLDPRLLSLGIVWEWRKQKGLPYAEDMQTYEIALGRGIAADNGQAGMPPMARASGKP
jgi:hypothetical protein